MSTYTVHTYRSAGYTNFAYLIVDTKSRTAAIIDPTFALDDIFSDCSAHNLKITEIWQTHSHYDHIGGIHAVRQRVDTRLRISKEEAAFWPNCPSDACIHDNEETFLLGSTSVTVLHTPGHTPGSCCYLLQDDLISGDTLFVYGAGRADLWGCGKCRDDNRRAPHTGCGRCDDKSGNPARLYRSLQFLKRRIPKHIRIRSGHDYGTEPWITMAEQLRGNPFLHFDDEAAFVRYRTIDHGRQRHMPYGPIEKATIDEYTRRIQNRA